MHLANPTEGQKKVTKSAYYDQQRKLKTQHVKILRSLEEQKIESKLIGIIESFFKLEDERKGKGLCVQKTEYLEILTAELDQFVTEAHDDPAPKLFRLFVRLNFNKEALYRYYRDHLNELLLQKEVDKKAILDQFYYKCSCPVRVDLSYNSQGNQLKEDMLSEVKNQRLRFIQDDKLLKPIRFRVTTGLMGAIISASIEASLIERPINAAAFYKTLSWFLRRADGTPYDKSTFKNAVKDHNEKHIREAREILRKMDEALDRRLELLRK